MYFWKIERLKEDIKNDRFGEKERFTYCVVCATLGAAVMPALVFLPLGNPNIWDMTSSIGDVLIVLVGTIFAYKANGGAKGTDFLGRSLSIGFVVSIRFLVLLVLLSIGIVLFYAVASSAGKDIVHEPVLALLFLLWYALMYWRICKHIGDVKNS